MLRVGLRGRVSLLVCVGVLSVCAREGSFKSLSLRAYQLSIVDIPSGFNFASPICLCIYLSIYLLLKLQSDENN